MFCRIFYHQAIAELSDSLQAAGYPKNCHSPTCLPSTPIGRSIPLSCHGLTGVSINLDYPVKPDNDIHMETRQPCSKL